MCVDLCVRVQHMGLVIVHVLLPQLTKSAHQITNKQVAQAPAGRERARESRRENGRERESDNDM